MNAKVQCCLLRHARQQSRSRESYPWLMYSRGYEKDALLRLEQVMNCGPGPSCWKGGYRYPLDKFLSSGNVIRWIVIFPVDSAIRVQKQPGPQRFLLHSESNQESFCKKSHCSSGSSFLATCLPYRNVTFTFFMYFYFCSLSSKKSFTCWHAL